MTEDFLKNRTEFDRAARHHLAGMTDHNLMLWCEAVLRLVASRSGPRALATRLYQIVDSLAVSFHMDVLPKPDKAVAPLSLWERVNHWFVKRPVMILWLGFLLGVYFGARW